jgi:hypothetical protein
MVMRKIEAALKFKADREHNNIMQESYSNFGFLNKNHPPLGLALPIPDGL